MTSLSIGLWLAALTIASTLATPVHVEQKISLSIGEPHEMTVGLQFEVSGVAGEPLPPWIVRSGTSLRMLPDPEAVKTYITMGSTVMEVLVHDQNMSMCEPESEWVEAVLSGTTPMELWDDTLELAKKEQIKIEDIRVVPASYAYSYRALTTTIPKTESGDTVIIVSVPCGEQSDKFVQILYEYLLEKDYTFEDVLISKGHVLSRAEREEDPNSIFSGISTGGPDGEELLMKTTTARSTSTSTRSSTSTSTRPSTTTTRAVRASSPITLMPVPSMNCDQGAYCEIALPEKTFMSSTGNIETFNLEVQVIEGQSDEALKAQPWVVMSNRKAFLRVLPTAAGEFNYRLVGTTKTGVNKKVAAPFSVIVKEAPEANHLFRLEMYSPAELSTRPSLVRDTIVRFAKYLRSEPNDIRVVNVVALPTDNRVILYTNTSIPANKGCPTAEVERWIRAIHHHKKAEFIHEVAAKHFAGTDPQLHPKSLVVEWKGECATKNVAPPLTTVGDAREEKGEEVETGSLSVLITVVCILGLLLALLCLVLCCVACRRRDTKRNEYMSKGTPVVFPEEVDDDHTDVPASAPMLVREERPPLRVSEHSNPLYKPPPPLTAASPRVTPAPLSASAQRLPPPYVPP